MNTVKVDLSDLRKFRSQLDELEKGRAQVGLFKDTAGRSADAGRIDDNPTLGTIHEFGSISHNIPERSFLRMPLTLHFGSVFLAKASSWLYLLRTSGAKRVLASMGVLGEEVVQESFATRGWGLWPALKQVTIRRKKSSAVLIETAQMRKAISSRVV